MSFAYINPEEWYKKIKGLKKEDVEQIKEWLKKQPHLPTLHDDDVIFALHSCYYSIEKTKLTIENHFTCKTEMKEFFGKKSDDDLQKAFNQAIYLPLPKLTPEGYQVLFCKMKCVPQDYNLFNHAKYLDGCLKVWFLERGPPEGFIILTDMEGYLFGHIKKIPLSFIKPIMNYCQDGLPVRLKGLHFINVPSYIDMALSIFKPFMKAELMNMLYLHTENDNVYKYIPKELFPKEYGGNELPLDEMHEANIKYINSKKNFFEIDESKWIDESKRQSKSTNKDYNFGISGSFKKLELD